MRNREVEWGRVICCNHKCTLGKLSRGTPTSVIIDMRCPKGSRAVGSWHTHPSSSSRLSPADWRNLRKAKMKVGCVSGREGLKCYKID